MPLEPQTPQQLGEGGEALEVTGPFRRKCTHESGCVQGVRPLRPEAGGLKCPGPVSLICHLSLFSLVSQLHPALVPQSAALPREAAQSGGERSC